MCETASRTIGRPRWGWLYGTTLAPLATLAVVEVAAPPTLLRAVLRSALGLLALAGLAAWLRGNRTAVHLQSWCACAPATITLRVIDSRRPLIAPSPGLREPALVEADADRVLVHR